MTTDDFDAVAVIDGLSPFLNLPIAAEYRNGVAIHLRAARAIAEGVLALELPDDAEPGPVFAA
jgi:hypothetical protein